MKTDEEKADHYAKTRQRRLTLLNKNPSYRLWLNAKYRASKLGLPFDITPEDVVIPETCPYLDIVLTNEHGHGFPLPTNVSLDRIVPERGYVKGNIQVLSVKANTMKNNASIQELLTFSKNFLDKHSEAMLQ